jgi:peptidoglycan/LPS O-acetylase OafA/YrhL
VDIGMEEKGRLDYLDSIRGLAALSVLCGHFWGAYGSPQALSPYIDNFPFAVIQDGSAAVSIFFVLSGLVLSLSYFRKAESGYRLSKVLGPFIIKRIARIVLPFAAILLTSLWLKHTLFQPVQTIPPESGWAQSFWRNQDTLRHLIRQAFLVYPTLADQDRLIPQDWTLTVELNLSFLVPFLILIAVQSSFGLVFLAIVCVELFRVQEYLYHFVAGILMAKFYSQLRQWQEDSNGWSKWTVFSLGFVLYGYRYFLKYLPVALQISEGWIRDITGLGAAVLIIAIAGSERLQDILHTRILTGLGRISYSFYLTHFAVLMCFSPRFVALINRRGIIEPTLANLLGLSATVATTVVLSALSYRYIELPSIQLGRLALNQARPLRVTVVHTSMTDPASR